MTDVVWNKDRLIAGLGWTFPGPDLPCPINESTIEQHIGSPIIAEACAIRSALCMALTLEISNLEVSSDCQTLIRVITGDAMAKEIIGIVQDVRVISAEFAYISFSHVSWSSNVLADELASRALHAHLSSI